MGDAAEGEGSARGEAPPPPRRQTFSYRTSLAVVVPLLVALSTGVVLVRTQLAARASLETLSEALFEEVSRQTVERTRGHLGLALPALDLLAAIDHRALRASDPVVEPRLLAALRANPGFSWVSYADVEGSFSAAYRPGPGRVRLNRSDIVDGRTSLREDDLEADGTRTPFRRVADSRYDPRTRPFFEAVQRTQRRTWLPPYVFYDQGIAGITCAAPQRDEAGALVGVYTVDFDLGALSRFVSEMRLSPRGEVFVLTEDGELLAHPALDTVVATPGEEGRLTRVEDVDDARFVAFREAAAGRTPALDTLERFDFAHEGERHLASLVRFELDEGVVWTVGALAPASDFLGAVEEEARTSLLFGIAALVTAILFALVLADRVSRPLVALAGQMRAVGRFEIDEADAPRSFFREIELMAQALASMKRGLASFARFVPRDLVRQVLASGREARLGGELRTLTVFFSDLAGFTTFAESRAPDRLVAELGLYLDTMTRTIGAGGGTVDKFLGDGIMAFWGAPADDPEHAAHACVTALRCQRALEAMAATEEGAWLRETHTRIGVATGELLVGNVGTPERLNYTVMGDIANLAARLESLGKQYGARVLVSDAARRAAGKAVIARPVDVVAVKGKAEAVRVWELLGLPGDVDEETTRAWASACERAFDRYLARDFEGAIEAWDALLDERPADGPVKVLRARASAFLGAPPPEGWDGSHVAESK
ncbi:MAG: hypothetical protein KF901_26640 [Myxococcales bacterium]|nr:hypothetical protein [Myxococcales bacterium]